MDVKKIALLIGALVIAATAAIMARSMFAGAGAEQAVAAPVPTGPKVLVAKKALVAGTIIDAESLTYQPWPKELIQSAYYVEGAADGDVAKLVGTVVRHPITAGQPVTRGSLVGPGDRGFLAAALAPGMRAITVSVNDTTGVAGFVFPGDRIDLVLTQTVPAGDDDGPPLKASETIVRNIRVLATDQRIDSKGEDGKIEVKSFTNVTLEATPRIAEKVAVAQSIGTLSLSLRSIADTTAELDRAVAAGEVRVPNKVNRGEERRMLMAAANRPIDARSTATTGGDVSRFQRRSLPPRKPGTVGEMNKAMEGFGKSFAKGVDDALGGSNGPSVRVARGNNVTVVPVGAR